jgi:site-specific recombinase XerC
VRATLRGLERLLDPLDAPLVALTPEMARALLQQEEGQTVGFADGVPGRCLSQLRARRFFRWAIGRGYVNRNPFDGVYVPLVEERQGEWLA